MCLYFVQLFVLFFYIVFYALNVYAYKSTLLVCLLIMKIIGISYKCIPNPSRVLVNKNYLNRVGLK